MAITPIVFTGATKDTIKSAFQKCNNMATDYAAATSGKGASLIGVYDSADNMAATNVEDALAEIYTNVSSARTMAQIFSTKASTTTGLTWGYYGGNIRTDNEVTTVEDGTVTLTDDATNYVEVAADGSVYASATSFTSERIPLWIIVCADGEQTTYTDMRAWFPTWPDDSVSLLVSGLKVIRNTTSVNCLEIFESSTGVAPTANTPIKVHIPNGTGYTMRTRDQAELSGEAAFTLADATGYWGYASANGSSYPAFVYAIWSASDECIVWGLSNVGDLTLCPTGETETASGYMLLEDSSTYTRTGTDFCVAVAKVEFEYDTGDTPDYTFATSASGKNIIIYGSEFSVLKSPKIMGASAYGLSDGATIAVDWTNGTTQYVTLAGENRTVTFSHPISGQVYRIILIQDETGNRTIETWPTIYWSGGLAPTLSTAGNSIDIVTLLYTGTTYYGDFAKNFAVPA